LREKLDRAYDKLKFKRNEEKNIAGDIEAAELRLKNLDKECGRMEAQSDELEARRSEAESALRDQNDKSQRAGRRLLKLRSDMRVAISGNAGAVVPDETDMQLAEARVIAASMLDELRALADSQPGVPIADTLRHYGIQLPAAPLGSRGGGGYAGSRTPSRASSVVSNTSSIRSASRRDGVVQIGY
jgi:hypothetical protein